ncbi:lysosome-associated membrane glycoprotein 1 [Copidosoma floridanum]|uniref:lysosome-associated membrane glycoprotein 1 n=1 Tax=Copidosoma floridanum TaxID=29053 RepID=UPI0006C95F87|nr:lysosome-associated membrane glycoprotein 1 [Copidosoma floridanum]
MRANIGLVFCCSLVLASVVYASDDKPVVPSTSVSPIDSGISKLTPNTTTTELPVTTSTVPTTSAPTPAPPVPEPKIGKWSINNTDAVMVLRLAAQIELAFNTSNQQTIQKKINIPADNSTMVTGDFKKSNETITLSWKASNATQVNFVSFLFKKDEMSKTYTLGSINVSIDASELSALNASLNLIHPIEHFNTTLGHSYRCVKLLKFNLTKPENNTLLYGEVKVTDFQFQAFKDDGKSSFGFAEDCAFETSDVVPIAVGCVLAGLVVIVLVAYLISRKRSQARGYLSM